MKNYRSLAELHYSKVYNHFQLQDLPIDSIQAVLEHIGLYNYLLAQNLSQKPLKAKHKLLFADAAFLINAVNELTKREKEDNLNSDDSKEAAKLLTWLSGQLNQTLKESIKFLSSGKTNRTLNHMDIKLAKKMFEVVLRSGALPDALQGKLQAVSGILQKLNLLYKEASK